MDTRYAPRVRSTDFQGSNYFDLQETTKDIIHSFLTLLLTCAVQFVAGYLQFWAEI